MKKIILLVCLSFFANVSLIFSSPKKEEFRKRLAPIWTGNNYFAQQIRPEAEQIVFKVENSASKVQQARSKQEQIAYNAENSVRVKTYSDCREACCVICWTYMIFLTWTILAPVIQEKFYPCKAKME